MFETVIDGSNESTQPMLSDPLSPGRPEVFRPVHYLGSKLRALSAIRQELDRLDPTRSPLCDLFAGSGTVSYAANHERDVIAVDIQNYSRLLCEALLDDTHFCPNADALAELLAVDGTAAVLIRAAGPLIAMETSALEAAMRGDLAPMADLLQAGPLIGPQFGRSAASGTVRRAQEAVLEALSRANITGVHSVALRHYGGAFFSFRQAIMIDAVRVFAEGHLHRTRLIAALMGAVSDAVNTVGKQFAQPMRLRTRSGTLKTHLRTKLMSDRRIDIVDRTATFLSRYDNLPRSRHERMAICADYRQALRSLKGRVGVVYADPPYTRDHYSRFYHVLETLALGDDPAVSLTNLDSGDALSRGVYRADRHQSDFCIKSKAPAAFADLFKGVAELDVPLLLSYSDFDADAEARPRVMSVEDVAAIARRYFTSVEVSSLSLFNHSKLNATRLNRGAEGTREVLISCSQPLG